MDIDLERMCIFGQHRFGSAVASAVIADCLGQGYAPFWICDEANLPSRRLAEALGFNHLGEIPQVDIPFDPFAFYRGLAAGFFLPQGKYRQAAEAYDRAFSVGEGEAEDYFRSAVAWASAGEDDRALDHLHRAVERGWEDLASLQGTGAFGQLRGTRRWQALIGSLGSSLESKLA